MLLLTEKIFAGTGHRPNKLAGCDPYRDAYRYLINNRPDKIITGMAWGFDLAWGAAALELNIPIIAAVPFSDQPNKFDAGSQRIYDRILRRAQVTVISDEYYPGVFQHRNIWMVDRCSHLIGYWNGTNGGTNNCIKYAKRKNVPIINLWST